jgi:putative hemolysin
MLKKIRSAGLMSVFAIMACTNDDSSQSEKNPSQEKKDAETATADPASEYCRENGGTLQIRKDGEGNAYGLCVFANGNECDLWAYYRGTCKSDNNRDADSTDRQDDAG